MKILSSLIIPNRKAFSSRGRNVTGTVTEFLDAALLLTVTLSLIMFGVYL